MIPSDSIFIRRLRSFRETISFSIALLPRTTIIQERPRQFSNGVRNTPPVSPTTNGNIYFNPRQLGPTRIPASLQPLRTLNRKKKLRIVLHLQWKIPRREEI